MNNYVGYLLLAITSVQVLAVLQGMNFDNKQYAIFVKIVQ